jgi:hypothetical protein
MRSANVLTTGMARSARWTLTSAAGSGPDSTAGRGGTTGSSRGTLVFSSDSGSGTEGTGAQAKVTG